MLAESGRTYPSPAVSAEYWLSALSLPSELCPPEGGKEKKQWQHYFGWYSRSSRADCVSCHSRSFSTLAPKWNWSWFVSSALQAGNALPLGPHCPVFPQPLGLMKCKERCMLCCPVTYQKQNGFPAYADSPEGRHNHEKGLLQGWPKIEPRARAHVGSATSQEESIQWPDCSSSHTANYHCGTREVTKTQKTKQMVPNHSRLHSFTMDNF